MQISWLGWAGVEIAAQGERVVIDPLADPLAVLAWLRERADAVPLPELVALRRGAIAGLLTHLHRDHADAGDRRTGAPASIPRGGAASTWCGMLVMPLTVAATRLRFGRLFAPFGHGAR